VVNSSSHLIVLRLQFGDIVRLFQHLCFDGSQRLFAFLELDFCLFVSSSPIVLQRQPVAKNTIELLEDISGGQSTDEPDAQLEADIDKGPAAGPIEDDGELTDQALYAFASDDDENDF
jgi:hypothetical protein